MDPGRVWIGFVLPLAECIASTVRTWTRRDLRASRRPRSLLSLTCAALISSHVRSTTFRTRAICHSPIYCTTLMTLDRWRRRRLPSSARGQAFGECGSFAGRRRGCAMLSYCAGASCRMMRDYPSPIGSGLMHEETATKSARPSKFARVTRQMQARRGSRRCRFRMMSSSAVRAALAVCVHRSGLASCNSARPAKTRANPC